jgi:hypothetical protein
MKKILNRGNLPRHLQLFAKQTEGVLTNVAQTEFYEINNIDEFERTAAGLADPDIRFEIFPTIDNSTDRAFLVGFEASSPEHIATMVDYAYLQIYFYEASKVEIQIWIDKIKLHREQQMQEMRARKLRIQASNTPIQKGDVK